MATPAVHHGRRHASHQPGRILLLGLIAVVLAGGLAVRIDRIASNGAPQYSRPSLQQVIDGLVTGSGRIRPA